GKLIDELGGFDFRLAEAAPQSIMVGEQPLDLRSEGCEISEIIDPDRAPSDLVLVGRADAAPGGADLRIARRRLADLIELAMERQDERGIAGHAQAVARDFNALRLKPVDLADECPRIDHHAIADDRKLARS